MLVDLQEDWALMPLCASPKSQSLTWYGNLRASRRIATLYGGWASAVGVESERLDVAGHSECYGLSRMYAGCCFNQGFVVRSHGSSVKPFLQSSCRHFVREIVLPQVFSDRGS